MFTDTPRIAFAGLLSQQPRWGLTWRGWLFVPGFLLIPGALLVLWIYPFLAVNKPVQARIMVVEGWISVPSLRAAADHFRRSDYEKLYTVGGPYHGHMSQKKLSYAQVTANQFIEMGIAAELVQPVPSGNARRDRTYSSAAALRDWLREENIRVEKLNVVTEGLHARRSRLMFKRAFGKGTHIGVISIPNTEFQPSRWWLYSEGSRRVVSETAAYLYARLLFRPALIR